MVVCSSVGYFSIQALCTLHTPFEGLHTALKLLEIIREILETLLDVRHLLWKVLSKS